MNISKLRQSNSAQINADDILSGPVTVTITDAIESTSDQPLFVSVAEFPNKTYRPSLTMRKVLGAVMGDETDNWIGRRVTLFRNPEIKFGREKVGGIQISHVSGIEGPVEVSVLVKRGVRETFRVDPLPDTPQRSWLSELELAGNDLATIGALGQAATQAGAPADVVQQIRERFNAVKGEQQ